MRQSLGFQTDLVGRELFGAVRGIAVGEVVAAALEAAAVGDIAHYVIREPVLQPDSPRGNIGRSALIDTGRRERNRVTEAALSAADASFLIGITQSDGEIGIGQHLLGNLPVSGYRVRALR